MRRSCPLACSLFLALGSLGAAQTCLPNVDVAATNLSGFAGNGASSTGSLSGDGRWLAFSSTASNLVQGDTNGQRDIFVKDLATGVIKLVSRSKGSLLSPSQLANGPSQNPSISSDGRCVAFSSEATNLVSGDTNGFTDVFVVDALTGDIERVSSGLFNTQPNEGCHAPKISSTGRYVVFHTLASNLVLFGDPNSAVDVYVRDRVLGITYPGSVTWDGQWGNLASVFGQISADGRFLVFESFATNMSLIDGNGQRDVFVRDFVLDVTLLVSSAPGAPFGVSGNGDSNTGSISDDGRYVAFSTLADNFAGTDTNFREDVFVRDLTTGTLTLASHIVLFGLDVASNSASRQPQISRDGRYVIYQSRASDLVLGDANGPVQDVFRYSRVSGTNALMSVTDVTGLASSAPCENPNISGDGKRTCWDSLWAFTLNDSNGVEDTFVRYECFQPVVFCQAKTTSNGCLPAISSSGSAYAASNGQFHISASAVINQKPGLLFYGLSGGASIPFQGGLLCVQPPTARSPLQFSGGNPGPNDCSGQFDLFVDAFALGLLGGNPLPQLRQAGTTISAQWWGRDPGYAEPNNTLLSNALTYTVLP